MEDMEQYPMYDFPLVQEVQFLQHPTNIYALLSTYMKKEQEQMLKLLSKIKVKKNHTFPMVYKCKYCDVKGLVLVEALDQQPKDDQEGALEGLKA